jgi:predicted kinase
VITVVTGPPCSGKSTYVREHRKPGDIVIDFDTLAQALGSPNPHDHSTAVRNVTIRMRRAAIEAALRTHDVDVWIVDCNISPDRMRAYQRAGATIRAMTVDSAELHRRASKERPALWHRLIDEWVPAGGAAAVPASREW